MKILFTFLATLSLSTTVYGSTSYGGTENRVQTALEAIHGIGAGVGPKNQSCLLCHATSAGGPGSLNQGFGIEFHDRANAMGFAEHGGGDLPATGALSLETIFSDATFAALDSDGDGDDNGTEFMNNTDPADDIQEESGGGGSGGCGMIAPPNGNNKFPPASMLLLLLPLAFLISKRKSPLKE